MKTLYVGLGGFGGRVVCRIKKQLEALGGGEDNFYVVLDRDPSDLSKEFFGVVPCVNLYRSARIRDLADQYAETGIGDWLPSSPYFMSLCVGDTGKIRAAGRLTFFDGMQSGSLSQFEDLIAKALFDGASGLRVFLVTSLVGGLGSGIFIQTALWIRKLLKKRFGICGEIHGCFVGADAFLSAFPHLRDNKRSFAEMKANESAALKELAMIGESIRSNGTWRGRPVELDGLLDYRTEEPIFNGIQVRVASANSAETVSYDRLLDKTASNMLRRDLYQSKTPEELLALSNLEPQYYQSAVFDAKQHSGASFHPHIDQRWIDYFV